MKNDLNPPSLKKYCFIHPDEDEISQYDHDSLLKNYPPNYKAFTFDRNLLEDVIEQLNMIYRDKEKKDINKKNLFKIKLILVSVNKKRGKEPSKVNKKQEHNAYSFDNIISKIQVHFLSFLISFLNLCISSHPINKRIKFLNFEHKIKSKPTKKHIEQVKYLTIKDLLQLWDISIKYTKQSKDTNKRNVQYLSNIPFFANLFQMKYLQLFSLYYNNQQPLKELTLFGKKIKISKKEKSFYELINSEKNKDIKEYIIEYTKMVYINDIELDTE